MIEATIISGVLVGSTALLIQELNLHPVVNLRDKGWKWAKGKYASNILMRAVVSGVSTYDNRQLEIKREALKEELKAHFKKQGVKTTWVYGWSEIYMVTNRDNLRQVRNSLREFFGSWSDKVDSTGCGEGTVDVRYRSTKKVCAFDVDIRVKYDLDDLPVGLLKPGCKIIRETQTVESCRIECAL